ncbi:Glycine N-acyltransferase-like 3, partial [Cuculus canorus]
MQILTCPAKLQSLEATLRRSLPLSLPVYGAVMHINRGNPGEMEVAVDSWPDFGAVLARQSGEVAGGDPWDMEGGGVGALGQEWGHWEHWGVGMGILGQEWGCWEHWSQNRGMGALGVEHAELLTETWPYGGTSRSRQYLVDMLSRLPNLCLQDETRYPVCWVLTDHFGTGAHGYTLRAHRRHGYMRAALAITAKRAHARGFPSYG